MTIGANMRQSRKLSATSRRVMMSALVMVCLKLAKGLFLAILGVVADGFSSIVSIDGVWVAISYFPLLCLHLL